MIAFLAFAIPFALYIGVPSCFWNFDGVACAAALELGQPSYFFHANHLLYGFFGFLFWKGIGQPLGIARALPALQLFTSILASLGLIGLYRLLLSIIQNRWSALLLTSTMAFTAAFWIWSIEAQVYTLGFLALAWATFLLIEDQNLDRKYIVVGILHGGAVLGHLMHVLWTLPALYWIVGECRRRHHSVQSALRRYLFTLGITTLVPYLLVIGFVIAPGRSLSRVLIWLKGSAGLTPDRHWAWHAGGVSGPWIALKSTAPALWGSFWPYDHSAITALSWFLTAVSVVLFLTLLIQSGGQRSDRLWRFSGLWLLVYVLFLSTWEPQTLCYRLTDVIPLGILLALGLRTWKSSLQLLAGTLLLGCTLTANLLTLIEPMHEAAHNSVYQDVLAVSKSTPADSLYITGGGSPWIYLLYFTGRAAWNAHSFEAPQLVQELNRQKRSHPVFIQSLLLRDPVLEKSLLTLKFKPSREGASWVQVQ